VVAAPGRRATLIRLAIRCRPELAESVLADLLELAPNGVEEERGGDYVEFAVYGAPGELPALPDLEAAAGRALVEVTSAEIPDDWADRWRDFHWPTVIANGRRGGRPGWEPGPGRPPVGGAGGEIK
jgi:ribosomal protein L11 methyltransferase